MKMYKWKFKYKKRISVTSEIMYWEKNQPDATVIMTSVNACDSI